MLSSTTNPSTIAVGSIRSTTESFVPESRVSGDAPGAGDASFAVDASFLGASASSCPAGVFLVAGYGKCSSRVIGTGATVSVYGCYGSRAEAEQRQAALHADDLLPDAHCHNSVKRGRGIVTWIKRVPCGDITGNLTLVTGFE